MKLTVLIPTKDYSSQAGARIRYGRLKNALAKRGVTLSMVEIGAFDSMKPGCDCVLISKCYSAQALVTAAALRRQSILVGVDLFDDYFSQEHDSRLIRFRSWLKQVLQLSDFATCSTQALLGVVQRFAPDMPTHIVNDPAPDVDIASLERALARKAHRARSEQVLKLAWFGMGDNPYFSVGLSDLAAYSSAIVPLLRSGMAVDLTVLTNPRALSPAGLTAIRNLPLQPRILEWSEEREAALLDESFACFLPVNAQPFSTAKSLNRAITALTAGCQVLTAGYPLYAPLDDFIYRSAEHLLSDLHRNRMKLFPNSVGDFKQVLETVSSAEVEADRLASFLGSLAGKITPSETASGAIYLLHGASSTRGSNESLRKAGGLSIRTPFSTASTECDIIATYSAAGRMSLLLNERAKSKARPEWRRRIGTAQKVGRRKYWELAPSGMASAHEISSDLSLPHQLALYPRVIQELSGLIATVFEPGTLLLSENSPLPFDSEFHLR